MWRRAEADARTRFDAKNYRGNQRKAVEFEADVGSASTQNTQPLKASAETAGEYEKRPTSSVCVSRRA
jgi:hypothetical protein